jgi:hypothetical protein
VPLEIIFCSKNRYTLLKGWGFLLIIETGMEFVKSCEIETEIVQTLSSVDKTDCRCF